jgi:hypothetical protein
VTSFFMFSLPSTGSLSVHVLGKCRHRCAKSRNSSGRTSGVGHRVLGCAS